MNAIDANAGATLARQVICHILPRGMRYSSNGATSIDLFVSEMAAHSRYRVEVIAEFAQAPLAAGALHPLPSYRFANSWRRARTIGRALAAINPAAVLVQQHLPSAAMVSARTQAPVILQKHNFIRRPRRSNVFGPLSAWRHLKQLNALAGLTFVSEQLRADFENAWPLATSPRCVIPNGVDFSAWRPAENRENFVLVVGRASPDKGLIEAARGLAIALPRHPGWSAKFVVSEMGRDPAYFQRLCAELAALGAQASLLSALEFNDVKALNERAAIALIPSLWREPFGRTCLEGHAGGAAVISSGTGGLREVSGDHALYLPSLSPADIATTLERLIDDAPLRAGLAMAGLARVKQKFDVRAVASALDDFCGEIIARRGRR